MVTRGEGERVTGGSCRKRFRLTDNKYISESPLLRVSPSPFHFKFSIRTNLTGAKAAFFDAAENFVVEVLADEN